MSPTLAQYSQVEALAQAVAKLQDTCNAINTTLAALVAGIEKGNRP